MQRIDTSTAAAELPAPLAGGAPGYFRHAAPGSGETPTVVSSDWCNAVQEELAAIIEYSGNDLDKDNLSQVLTAILSILDGAGVNGAGSIFGMTIANTPGFTTTRVTTAAGLCRDSTNTAKIPMAAPIAKDLTALWAAGNNNGGRDTGALANGQTWHVFAILKPADSTADMLFSQSPTAPNLPAGFTKFRRLGAVLLEASATTIRQFIQVGDYFELKIRSTDYAAQSQGAANTANLRKISVPNGIKVEATLYFQSVGTSNDSNAYLSGVYDPDLGVPPAFGPSTQWAQVRRLAVYWYPGTWNSYSPAVVTRVFSDTAQQIYTISNDVLDVIALGVLGWRDERGKFF